MPRKINLPPSPSMTTSSLGFQWMKWFNNLFERVGEGPFQIQGYRTEALPTASSWGSVSTADPFSSMIFVSNESGGPTLAFSDGTNWRRVQDRVIVS